jgi:hypothetical protein
MIIEISHFKDHIILLRLNLFRSLIKTFRLLVFNISINSTAKFGDSSPGNSF